MASSGLAATGRQLYHPPVTASSPGALAWLQGLRHPHGPGSATPAGPGPGLEPGPGLGPGPGPGAWGWALAWAWDEAWAPCQILLLELLSLLAAHWPIFSHSWLTGHPRRQWCISFMVGFPWSKGGKPCRPVHLLYLMSELQQGCNRKKTTMSAPRWIKH